MSEAVPRDRTSHPYRVILRLAKYSDEDAYARGEPDEVIERVVWYEADGSEIVDSARIAELETQDRKEE